ncbi:MAG: acyltransferase family protein, partial [Psychrosphaera sp.]|nr:acyltransferase family protein [Psychrosphaera sp.]
MNTRYYGLDFARAILMLLGIFYHSSLIYIHDGQWHVSHSQHSQFFNLLADFIHYFRMDAFYIIAGFFFVLVVEKYGAKKTLIERMVKLGVPLLVVGFSFNAYLSGMHQENAAMWSFEYIINGQWLHHLWFIGNLIVYYIVAIWFVDRFTTAKAKAHPMKKIAFFALFVTP